MKRFVKLIVLLLFFPFIWVLFFLLYPLPISDQNANYELRNGHSLKYVARDLTQKHILIEPYAFVIIGKLLGWQSHIKAGSYEFNHGISAYQLLTKISRGDSIDYEVKIIDGMTFAQLESELKNNPYLTHDSQNLTVSEITQYLQLSVPSPEGVLYPDTYFFNPGEGELRILKRAKQNMDSHLNKLWASREPNLWIATPYDALIMASLVEKESGIAYEQPKIAAVFFNRLKLGMRLQTDPTVIFGMGLNYQGKLHHKDLTKDTPYNTYTRAGLPPTPISFPSQSAIEAVLHPAQTRDLYFVATGNGGHFFSETLAVHHQAVIQYQKHKQH